MPHFDDFGEFDVARIELPSDRSMSDRHREHQVPSSVSSKIAAALKALEYASENSQGDEFARGDNIHTLRRGVREAVKLLREIAE